MTEEKLKELENLASEVYNSRMQKIRENDPDMTEYIKCILNIFSASTNSSSKRDEMVWDIRIKCEKDGKLQSFVTFGVDTKLKKAEEVSIPEIKEAMESLNELKGDGKTLSSLYKELSNLPYLSVSWDFNKILIRIKTE